MVPVIEKSIPSWQIHIVHVRRISKLNSNCDISCRIKGKNGTAAAVSVVYFKLIRLIHWLYAELEVGVEDC